jgi:hypothetical protein
MKRTFIAVAVMLGMSIFLATPVGASINDHPTRKQVTDARNIINNYCWYITGGDYDLPYLLLDNGSVARQVDPLATRQRQRLQKSFCFGANFYPKIDRQGTCLYFIAFTDHRVSNFCLDTLNWYRHNTNTRIIKYRENIDQCPRNNDGLWCINWMFDKGYW